MDSDNFERYLNILDVQEKKTSLESLSEILKAQLMKIPFENISKLYYKKKFELEFIPGFAQYLDGVENCHFGGTCYTTNYYLHELLKFLGYDVDLCGANMKHPDVHIANIVKINGQEYIADVGYGAPLLDPIPRDLTSNYKINSLDKTYLLSPKDKNNCSTLYFQKNGEYKNGYILKPESRKITDFKEVIKDSFKPEAMFMNTVLLSLFGEKFSLELNNFHFEEHNGKGIQKKELQSKSELFGFIEQTFHIPKSISSFALENLTFSNKNG